MEPEEIIEKFNKSSNRLTNKRVIAEEMCEILLERQTYLMDMLIWIYAEKAGQINE